MEIDRIAGPVGKIVELAETLRDLKETEEALRKAIEETADLVETKSRLANAFQRMTRNELLEREEVRGDGRPYESQVIYELFALACQNEWLEVKKETRWLALRRETVLAYWLAKGCAYQNWSPGLSRIRSGQEESLRLSGSEDVIELELPAGKDFYDHVSEILQSKGASGLGPKRGDSQRRPVAEGESGAQPPEASPRT